METTHTSSAGQSTPASKQPWTKPEVHKISLDVTAGGTTDATQDVKNPGTDYRTPS